MFLVALVEYQRFHLRIILMIYGLVVSYNTKFFLCPLHCIHPHRAQTRYSLETDLGDAFLSSVQMSSKCVHTDTNIVSLHCSHEKLRPNKYIIMSKHPATPMSICQTRFLDSLLNCEIRINLLYYIS